MKTHVKEIERLVEHLSEDWIDGKLEAMEPYFHQRAVMVEPGTGNRITGADAVIERYRDFIEEADISSFKITEMFVDFFETTAVAFFTYRIKYQVESTNYDETNAEILVFRQHEEEWQIVWRTQLLGQ
ncbi:YybH family protein [Fodinibius sediminis]|uniref:SnoaL-like domain-containing protein n=1 Tax=Fodinibius sediminis TaxID=1214077 RepID=A0A521BE45_9BACT|nr:nuclear transport factor 2 family protein [Fodinibius sediminis]SMO45344.1 protein of unknown function [Fodinibius sediminis]